MRSRQLFLKEVELACGTDAWQLSEHCYPDSECIWVDDGILDAHLESLAEEEDVWIDNESYLDIPPCIDQQYEGRSYVVYKKSKDIHTDETIVTDSMVDAMRHMETLTLLDDADNIESSVTYDYATKKYYIRRTYYKLETIEVLATDDIDEAKETYAEIIRQYRATPDPESRTMKEQIEELFIEEYEDDAIEYWSADDEEPIEDKSEMLSSDDENLNDNDN